MHWFAWWKLCYPKSEGGMGFRDFHSFNLSMLAKQVWRLVNDPESLCARVLRAKYYPHGDILKAGQKLVHPIPGKVLWRELLRSSVAIFGELVMVKELIFGPILGSLRARTRKSYQQEEALYS
jgi:hypothetical protein